MHFKTWLFASSLFFSTLAGAGNCLMAEALKDPKLAQNSKFWEDYGLLAAKGEVPVEKMKALIEKHGGMSTGTAAEAAAPKTFEKSLLLSVHHKAEKEIKALPKSLKQKVDEFLEIAMKPGGMKEIRENPGRWHLEKLKGAESQTVRLNGDYRVNFVLEGDSIRILRVNADQIHGI